MIDKHLTKYRYVREYDTSAIVTESEIYSYLQNAWKVTPSKNNFMPYRLTVVGPDRQDLKDIIYNLCLDNERSFDSNILDLETFYKVRYTKTNTVPQFHNIKSAPFVLIFTQRHADKLNPWQQDSVNRGRRYEQLDASNPIRFFKTCALEIGMFANNFARQCLTNGLDISHTLCTPTEISRWTAANFPINTNDHNVMLVMTAGKGLIYRDQSVIGTEADDLKPAFEDIVQFLK